MAERTAFIENTRRFVPGDLATDDTHTFDQSLSRASSSSSVLSRTPARRELAGAQE
ncbi:hypothetical protein [Planctomonas deserti]|jgi:hypothetical protein|uniref:hypothetical protein n=1 Tax=Planctomonas deserti TaxID=2144185 RepID=UPI00131F2926|nr:hypothetical protein [Planctomonas deserti]